MRLWAGLAWTIICGTCLTANADTITYDGGGTHTLLTTTADSFELFDGPGSQSTTLEIADGGNVTGQISATQHSVVRVTGGLKTFQSINLFASASGLFSGGFVQGAQTFQTATLALTGGSVDQLTIRDDSVLDIYKSTFTNGSPYSGVYLMDNALVSFYGSSFVLTDVPDTVFPEAWDMQQLTGLFRDGSAFAVAIWYSKSDPGTLSLVPEPSTYFLAMMGIVALPFARRRKRRTLRPGEHA